MPAQGLCQPATIHLSSVPSLTETNRLLKPNGENGEKSGKSKVQKHDRCLSVSQCLLVLAADSSDCHAVACRWSPQALLDGIQAWQGCRIVQARSL